MFDFKTAGPAALADVMTLVSETGWPHRPDDVRPLLDLGRLWCAVDRKSGSLAGMAVWWPMGRDHGRVGLVIVSPRYQRQGLGRALMERVLVDADGRSLALLATEDGRPLYEKLGFRSIGRTQRHVGQYVPQEEPHTGIEAYTPADLEAVLSVDRLGFGPHREPMVRHLLDAGTACVARDAKDVVGYGVYRPFGLGHVVGPVVAASGPVANALFHAVARPGYVRLDRPLEAEELGRLIETKGLEGFETTHTMVLGDWPAPGNGFRVFALSNHAWG